MKPRDSWRKYFYPILTFQSIRIHPISFFQPMCVPIHPLRCAPRNKYPPTKRLMIEESTFSQSHPNRLQESLYRESSTVVIIGLYLSHMKKKKNDKIRAEKLLLGHTNGLIIFIHVRGFWQKRWPFGLLCSQLKIDRLVVAKAVNLGPAGCFATQQAVDTAGALDVPGNPWSSCAKKPCPIHLEPIPHIIT